MTERSVETPSGGDSHPDAARAREIATRVGKTLIEHGHEAYFAGGCVRDRLLGFEPDDYDIATSARPEDIGKIFRSAYGVGESFGVMLVRMSGVVTQVATFRTDGVYSDGRHPDQVTFSDAEHDAQRRDFTINALFEHPLTGAIIDYTGGQSDLRAKMIRAVGDPHARLREDNLRMLRAVRFAARFGFTIEEETAAAIQESAGALRGVSRERIGQEIRRMYTHANRAVAAWEMQYLGLDEPVLLEHRKTVAPTRLGRLPDSVQLATCLAAWLLDRHERVAGGANSSQHAGDRPMRVSGGGPNGHGVPDVTDEPIDDIVRRWSSSLVLSNAESSDLMHTLEIYQKLRQDWWSEGVARQKRIASQPQFEQALLILQAIDRQAFIDVRRQTLRLAETELQPEPLIDGEDLKALGIKPGPVFRRVLEAVYDAQLEGTVKDRESALRLARFVAESQPGLPDQER
jgi:poly(A) polymerase